MTANQQRWDDIEKHGKYPNANTNSTHTQDDVSAEYYSLDDLVETKIYKLRQSRAYLSILFSFAQTVILIAMMVMCHVAPLRINPMIGPYPDALDYWGAKNSYKILKEHEYWRLISPILLHGGVIHLLSNVFVQIDPCGFWEKEWGSGVWLTVYISSGYASSILSVICKPNNISVGSSGAVMGLFGAKLAEILCRCRESSKTTTGKVGHEVRSQQVTAVLCTIILVGAFSFVPYVDWAAHLGGLLGGWCTGMILFSSWIKTRAFFILWCCVGIAMTVCAYYYALKYMFANVQPDEDLKDVCEYYQQFFEDYECNCRKVN